MKLQNKVIVVTGGGNGIGRELVLQLLSRGAQAAAVDINEPALQETVKLAGSNKDRLSTHVVNITNQDAVSGLPEQIISRHGAVDGIINNAGIIQSFVKVNDLDYAAIRGVAEDQYSIPRSFGAWLAPLTMLAFTRAAFWLRRRRVVQQ